MQPDSEEALGLDRLSFLRELGIAVMLSTGLPIAVSAGVFFASHGFNLLAVAVCTICGAAITAVPLLCYAFSRLNAATLARERAVRGGSAPKIFQPFQRPFSRPGLPAACSVKSAIIAALPGLTGMGMTGVVLSSALGTSILTPVNFVLGINLIVAALVIGRLLM